MNYQFYCRTSKAAKNGLAPIELSITIDGKRTVLQLERKEFPHDFQSLITSKKQNTLKLYLDGIRGIINEAINYALFTNTPLTIDLIKSYIRNRGLKQYSIQELMSSFLELQFAKVTAGYCTECVYQKYLIITNHFLRFIGNKTDCNAIRPSDIEVFYSKMKNIYVDSTLSGQMFRLRAVFNYGVENGYLSTNPFKIKITRAKPQMEFLTNQEIEQLRTKNLHNDRLDRVRDIALFQAGSGLAYADLVTLTPSDVRTSTEGYMYISKERCKTGITFTAVLLPCAIDVWNKYNGQLPIISNQRYNSYLKEIQDICGISKSLHTHLFRKTYATHLLNSGCRLDVVAKAMGHTSTQITAATYAFMQKNTVINEIGRIITD